MQLPIKFPSDTDVILEDVARMRALSQEEQVRAYRGLSLAINYRGSGLVHRRNLAVPVRRAEGPLASLLETV